jgi:hypothetical protein
VKHTLESAITRVYCEDNAFGSFIVLLNDLQPPDADIEYLNTDTNNTQYVVVFVKCPIIV